MVPNVPKQNLFDVMFKDLMREFDKVKVFILEYKWYLAVAAAILIVIVLLNYRGNHE